MSVKASTIFSTVRSMLDDDDSVRYTESADLVPAMNSALDYITAVYSAAFESKKLQPAALSELTTVWMIAPTVSGNTAFVNLDDYDDGSAHVYNDEVWVLIEVEPAAPIGAGGAFSYANQKFAKRVPLDKWGFVLDDPFADGYADKPADFIKYAYTGPGNYHNDGSPYLMIRPSNLITEGETVSAIWVLLKHPAITAGTSELLFPVMIHSLIAQKMVQYITYQGDDDRLFKITDKEVKELIQLMN